jgi:hypothetical protein
VSDLLDFSAYNILVIGDVMADYYLFGEVNRISPEAPVPVVEVDKKEMRLGGAANVALNLRYLGANPTLLSYIGLDETGKSFLDLMKKKGLETDHILQSRYRTTTLKTRVFDEDKQVVRFDEEEISDLEKNLEEHFIKELIKILNSGKIHMILLEDIHFLHFRDLIYDIFIYHLDITDCIWYIINNLIKKNYLKQNKFTNLMITTYCFFQYYNNNYRPIYHLENYLLKIVQMMNE